MAAALICSVFRQFNSINKPQTCATRAVQKHNKTTHKERGWLCRSMEMLSTCYISTNEVVNGWPRCIWPCAGRHLEYIGKRWVGYVSFYVLQGERMKRLLLLLLLLPLTPPPLQLICINIGDNPVRVNTTHQELLLQGWKDRWIKICSMACGGSGKLVHIVVYSIGLGLLACQSVSRSVVRWSQVENSERAQTLFIYYTIHDVWHW